MTTRPISPSTLMKPLAAVSIAEIVLDAGKHRRRPGLRRGFAVIESAVAVEVLGMDRAARRGPWTTLGIVVAVLFHGAAAAFAWSGGKHEHADRASSPMVVEVLEALVRPPEPDEPEPELAPEPAPEPEPEPEAEAEATPSPAASQAVRAPTPRAVPSQAPASEPAPAPAQAGEVVMADDAAAPLDFTGFDIVSGGGSFAGGATMAAGTDTRAVFGRVGAGGDPRPVKGKASRSRARPVTLASLDWKGCPWPSEAESVDLETQVVLLRVIASDRGQLQRVEIISDPGHGFAAQARKCASAETWLPALDERGRPYTATSPVFRLTFHR